MGCVFRSFERPLLGQPRLPKLFTAEGHRVRLPVRNCATASNRATVPPKAPPAAMMARGTGIPPATDNMPAPHPTGTAASRMMAVQTARGASGDPGSWADGMEATGTVGVGRDKVFLLDTRPRFTSLRRWDNLVDAFRPPDRVRAADQHELRISQSGKT